MLTRILMSICLLCIIITGLFHGGALAEDTKIPLTIDPVYPKNQNPQTKGYFDLSVNPNTKQSLSIKITNNKAKQVMVNIIPANAYTNPSGGMMYQQEINSSDTVLLPDAIRMAKYIEVQRTVTVPPLSSVEVPIIINVPKSDGQTLLGGILFTVQGGQKVEQQPVKKGIANFVLKSETVYAVALQLNLPNKEKTHFSFGKVGFTPENGTLFVEMTNDSQKIQNEIKGTYTVSNTSGKQLFAGNYGPFKMAPKSRIRYPIQWGNKTLNNGKYIINIKGTVDGKSNTTIKNFQIGNNDIKEYTQRVQSLPQTSINKGIPKWIWVICAIIFGLVMYFLGRRKSPKKE